MRIRSIVILALSFVILALPVAASVCGETVDTYSVILSDDAVLFENMYWTGSDLRTEFYIEAKTGENLSPGVICSNDLWQKESFQFALKQEDIDEQAVLAGINGGYYTVATGEPVGIIVTHNRLLADDEGLFAIGFQENGQPIFGQPQIRMTIKVDGIEIPVCAINRTTGNGIRVFTSDYASKIEAGEEAIAVLCSASNSMSMNGEFPIFLEEVIEDNSSFLLSENQLLFLIPKGKDIEVNEIKELFVSHSNDEEMFFSCECNKDWETVESAVGILYPLIINGEIRAELDKTAAPRTAIGYREDGSLVFYVLDGRQNGYSIGAGLNLVAQRMLELGCIYAGALDGGGSTQLHVNLDTQRTLKLINKPSEGRARNVSNYLALRSNQHATGQAVRLIAEPYHIHAVSGASIPIALIACDKYGFAAPLPSNITYEVSNELGEVRNGVYYANGNGVGMISINAPGCDSTEIPLQISDSPDSIELFGEKYGRKTDALTLEPRQEVDLTVHAKANHLVLSGNDECYTWNLEEKAGTVDEKGHIIAGNTSCTGNLQVSMGNCVVQIPISVWTGIPFSDVSADSSFFKAVKYVYEQGIFKGTGETVFDPNTVMTRGMLVTVLWRMSGEPTTGNSLSFVDVGKGSWYESAVAWATENGLVNGYSETVFAPNDNLTMEQIMTILYRWAGEPNTKEIETSRYITDYAHEYAVNALIWADNYGFLQNDIQDMLPTDPMTRAMVAEAILFWADYAENAAVAS